MRRQSCMLLYLFAVPAFAALDLNGATEAELDALPGVGPSRAQAIIEYRTKNGPFANVDELRNVKGIGDKTLSELKPLLVVGAASGATVAPRAEVPASPAVAEAAPSGGFPWWIAVLVVVAAVAAYVLLRRRAPQAPAQSQPIAETPVSATKPAASAPKSGTPSSPLPRPAGGVSSQDTTSATVAPPVRPAGAPPRPAGSSAPAALSDSAPPAAPKPAGAPPKPAGSH
ncbi:helix-hairpin-helix domain-containing protein [Methyloversatilis sp.]|uniref:helix-hairpin-helix domain-containing protein n=1 Tax=Methyloversatilis sp. TaxID=2569862 RepID=UPI0035B08BFD